MARNACRSRLDDMLAGFMPRGAALIALPAILMGGCATDEPVATSVTAKQFNRSSAPEGIGPVAAVPAEEVGPPKPLELTETTEEPSGTQFIQSVPMASTTNPGGKRVEMPTGDLAITAKLAPGKAWPVDSLVGQINGKAIYANEFFKGMESRLIQEAKNPDRIKARREIVAQVTQRFEDSVNNRLVISEAESSITPEMREGLFEFIRNMQEKEIAERGGTRTGANASLKDEWDMTVEQFMERKKNEALAGDLLHKRLAPRTIVSWRDIERAYEKDYAKYNPPTTLTLGYIGLFTQTDAAKIEQVKAMFAEGKTFTEVAHALAVKDDGVWRTVQVGPEGIEGVKDMPDAIKDPLKGLNVGEVTAPIQLGAQTRWFTILDQTTPTGHSIYDPEVQLRIRNELQGQRGMVEQFKYLQSLRSRWISEDIDTMRLKLIQIALERYYE